MAVSCQILAILMYRKRVSVEVAFRASRKNSAAYSRNILDEASGASSGGRMSPFSTDICYFTRQRAGADNDRIQIPQLHRKRVGWLPEAILRFRHYEGRLHRKWRGSQPAFVTCRTRSHFASTHESPTGTNMGVKRWLDDFVRMRHYRDRAAEFELLADAEPPSQVRLRYRIIAQHYKALADREERADQTRMAERLERLRLERRA